MKSHPLVAGRELYRFYVRYFQRATNADTTNQWLDIARGKCENGKLAKFCAKWDDVLGLLTRPSPSDFLLRNFLRHVSREDSMITIVFSLHVPYGVGRPDTGAGNSGVRLAASGNSTGATRKAEPDAFR